jgi:hypothetical protein
MFYGHLGNSTPCASIACSLDDLIPGLGLVNTGLFEDLSPAIYFTDTAMNAFATRSFNLGYGIQMEFGTSDHAALARLWAVHDGDIGASVPLSSPSALALSLLGLALLSLVGVVPRRAASKTAQPAL